MRRLTTLQFNIITYNLKKEKGFSEIFREKVKFFIKLLYFCFCEWYNIYYRYLSVAQPDRAQASDAWCQRFESAQVGQKNDKIRQNFVVFYSSRRLGMESRVSVYGIAVGVWHHQRCIFLRLDSIRLLCNQFHTATSCGFHARLRRD